MQILSCIKPPDTLLSAYALGEGPEDFPVSTLQMWETIRRFADAGHTQVMCIDDGVEYVLAITRTPPVDPEPTPA